eukprot:676595-Rhodomonas_salina.1
MDSALLWHVHHTLPLLPTEVMKRNGDCCLPVCCPQPGTLPCSSYGTSGMEKEGAQCTQPLHQAVQRRDQHCLQALPPGQGGVAETSQHQAAAAH